MKKVNLEKRAELTIKAKSPFNFKYSVYKPSHFPTGLEHYDFDSNTFYRTFRLNESCMTCFKMSNLKNLQGVEGIFAELYSNKELDTNDINTLVSQLTCSYGLDEDIKEFYQHVKNDRRLGQSIHNLYGMRNSCFETLFEILNISCILQNTTVKRSEQMMNAMLSTFGKRVECDGVELYAFYTPRSIIKSSEEELKQLKVGYRAKFLLEIAKYFLNNEKFGESIKTIHFEDAKKTLMEIKGIGPYSANLAVFAYLRHPKFLNLDVWNNKILSDFLFGHKNATLDQVSQECDKRWGNYKGYAALYVIEDLFVRNPELQYWRLENGKTHV